ncbi:ABC transporter permease [Capnocytophaga canimorsus]|uniref:ABC transporter permease n=1 Tax=Capnocytophaga canimorsus TaxID=28188 RepID=UPI000D6E8704|nr:ABC transporter permease [Capnocytophaga canimorsus]AWL79009.1 ABC transporter permease [Capnocytophaga canimorsus]AYW37607.1 ABC transporter permease [Capnocytophaga canimorsus]MDT9499008.1 ABC transporter permease [Capnocytophaga canimorsus]
MRRIKSRIYIDSQAYMKSLLWEWKYIFRDKAVLFSFLGVSLIVPFLYTFVYSHETLEKLPIGVVDNDNSGNSRQLLRMMDGSSQVTIFQSYPDLVEARQSFERQEIRGVVVIPDNFSQLLQRGEQPFISVYADASYLLYYKQILTAVKTSAAYLNAGIQIKKESAQGKLPTQARNDSVAVSAKTVSLYNPSSGYATFLIPVVLVIIFQTCILTSIGILGGTMREGKKLRKLYPHSDNFLGTLPIVMGKATTYLVLGLAILLVMLGVVMPVFNIPMRNNLLTVVVFMIPFLLSLVYLGIFLLNFFKHREDAIMLIMYTSIPALLITGISWPTTSIPNWIQVISYLVPSTIGAKGFVSLTQMGASAQTIQFYWVGMWLVCLFYLLLAVLSMKRMYLREK